MPILLDFIKLMNSNYQDFIYIFHSTKHHYDLIKSYIKSQNISNCEIISDDKIKSHTLRNLYLQSLNPEQSRLKFANLRYRLLFFIK